MPNPIKPPPTIIEGVRVRLRRSSPDDARETFAAAAHGEVMQYLDWPAHRNEADASAYLQGCERRWLEGSEYHWMVVLKPTGQVIGHIAARAQAHAADIGFLLGRAAWGQGYGTEAGKLLVGWLQRQPEIVRIWATADPDNARALKVLGKLGLVREGLLRRATHRPQMPGAPRDTVVLAWVREAAA